ncbi:LysR family transcriptional regulator [Rhodovarius lipocyclicus]|uniref:LysR family transcriptional regulator n=1 Tax=Rhodovarius lipocyclicus TaxID=268410 RepID=UPI001357DA53|nr:LysR family transcriptional regulator [Rhodovarius lipocyclicus]
MPRYTLAQLEAVTWIARLGSFHAAAQHLGITQPSISQRVRELEAALGHAVFLRSGAGARLTEAGETVLRYAERGLDVLGEMERRLSSGDPLTGTLRLGASNAVALSCLPAILAALEATYPRLNVALTVQNSAVLARLLDARELDVAFMAEEVVERHVRMRRVALCDVVWMSSPARPLAPETLRPADLMGSRIITLPEPSPLHGITQEWFAQEGLRPPAFATCNDMATVLRLIAGGVGMGIVPLGTAGPELQARLVQPYRARPELRPLVICAAHQDSARGAGLEAILRLGEEMIGSSPYFRRVGRG